MISLGGLLLLYAFIVGPVEATYHVWWHGPGQPPFAFHAFFYHAGQFIVFVAALRSAMTTHFGRPR